MRACIAALGCLGVVACGSTTDTVEDVCTVAQSGSTGSVEIGHGKTDYVSLVEGETFELELGPQGLWMFILKARASGMDIGDGDTAAIWYNAIGPSGETISLDSGCRERGFARTSDGALELTDPYLVAILPAHTSLLTGSTVAIEVIVRDVDGNEATNVMHVVTKLPSSM